MTIAEPFIRRPIMTTLVMAAILLFGMLGYRSLAVSDLPNVDFPTIQVAANLPGANPDTMAAAVATPMEKQFSTIAGIDSMTSTSTLGSTSITLQFDLSRNIDGAAQDVQAAISRVAGQLPPNMPSPPTFQKVNPADQPVYFMALSSHSLPLYTVDQYAETLLGQRISMVKGVAQVQVFGAQKYAVRIQLDPQALAARQIGIDEVNTAVQNANVNLPTGTLYGTHQAFAVQANGQLTRASLYRPLIVAYRNGSPVRLDELGNVIDSVQSDKISNFYNDEHAVILAIQRQPGTNTVEVVKGVRKILPQFQAILPPSILMTEIYDRSALIQESVNDVKSTLFLAICVGRAGDFPLPAQSFGHGDSEHRAADVHCGYVCGDVPAELHGGQSFADGADAFGGIRGGRRDRDAGKHRAPYGDGRNGDGGGAERLERDRIHDRFDDAVARGCVHPGAVHGRNYRAAAA